MRVMTLAVTSLLAICVAGSAFAATKKHPMANSSVSMRGDFDKCEQQSYQLGAPPGQNGHREWMLHCLYGIVRGSGIGRLGGG
jgi:hypothetical protein